jgi:hypothetical protein
MMAADATVGKSNHLAMNTQVLCSIIAFVRWNTGRDHENV